MKSINRIFFGLFLIVSSLLYSIGYGSQADDYQRQLTNGEKSMARYLVSERFNTLKGNGTPTAETGTAVIDLYTQNFDSTLSNLQEKYKVHKATILIEFYNALSSNANAFKALNQLTEAYFTDDLGRMSEPFAEFVFDLGQENPTKEVKDFIKQAKMSHNELGHTLLQLRQALQNGLAITPESIQSESFIKILTKNDRAAHLVSSKVQALLPEVQDTDFKLQLEELIKVLESIEFAKAGIEINKEYKYQTIELERLLRIEEISTQPGVMNSSFKNIRQDIEEATKNAKSLQKLRNNKVSSYQTKIREALFRK